ncbi:MAG: flagellar biosynthesis protein FlgN [Treponema sp.]|jgi:hypothetical protein|nr:flagellar biosynthesis protein FlgN [Treponema sp.]
MTTLIEEAAVATAEISPQELTQRIAVLRRFRTLLQDQRNRFRSYLEVLDKQQDIIESGNTDELLAHVEMEERLVADIYSIQKVIDPLDEMYRSLVSGMSAGPIHSEKADDVSGLKAALDELKSEAVLRSSRNREMLSRRMVELRSEIKALRNNPFAATARRSASWSGNIASLVDIQG